MPYLDIEGDKLHFAIHGSGVPVVFIHGSCGGAGQWKKLASMLQEDYRTICVDLLGSGQSEPWRLNGNGHLTSTKDRSTPFWIYQINPFI